MTVAAPVLPASPSAGGLTASGAIGSGLGEVPAGLAGLFSLFLGRAGLDGVGESGEGALTDLLLGSDGVAESQELLDFFQNLEGDVFTDLPELTALVDDVMAQVEMLQTDGVTHEGVLELGVQIQQVVVTLRQDFYAGGVHFDLGEDAVEDLAKALEFLGYPEDQALELATQIETALAYFDEVKSTLTGDLLRLLNAEDIKTSEATDLSGLLAAVFSQSQAPTTTRVVQVSQTIVQVQARQVSSNFAAQAVEAPVMDVAEKVALDKPLVPEKPALNPVAQAVHVSHDAPELMPAVVQPAVERTLKTDVRPVTEAVSERVLENGSIQTERAVKAAAPTFGSGTATTAPAPLEGKVMFQWQTTAAGMDVMQQHFDVAQARAEGVAPDMMLDVDLALEEPAIPSQNRMSFAEKMAQFAKNAQLGQQVQPVVKTLLDQGGGTIRMTLHPAELGEIEIELDVFEGQVKGTIASQHPEVVEQLARDLQFLKQGLADAGLNLSDEGIAFLLQDQGSGGEGGSPDDDAEGWQDEESLLAEGGASDSWVDPNRLVDMNV